MESVRRIDLASCQLLYEAIETSNTPVSDYGWLCLMMKRHDIKWTELDPGKPVEEIKETFGRRLTAAVTRVAGIGECDVAACQAAEERAIGRTEDQLRDLGRRYIAEHPAPPQ